MSGEIGPIGVFDSGYGGLTVYKEIIKHLPQYDYIYLGDNARVPYGTRSQESVYKYTLECVSHMFDMGCRLVIIACNTASAKALRTIQQNDLPKINKLQRVLGVIRPTSEIIGTFSKSGNVGVFATQGTVNSNAYVVEICRFFPDVNVFQQACPLWVPLVENNECDSAGADYFVKKYIGELMSKSPDIDAILLGCTHYPLLEKKIQEFLPPNIKLVSQGEIVATSLADYLKRHPEIEVLCGKNGKRNFYTTESPEEFSKKAVIFLGEKVNCKHLELE